MPGNAGWTSAPWPRGSKRGNKRILHIQRLEVLSFPVPFRVVFKHASASRARAENLIVAAHSDCGLVGYGEGCPRQYVTGETTEGGAAFIREHAASIIASVTGIHSLREWIDAHREVIDRNPAAFCALEIALLDLLGKTQASPVEQLLGLPPLAGRFAYTAVLGDSPYPAYWWQHRRYRKRGFRDFKVKASDDLKRDRRKLGLFRNQPYPQLRVRLDANNLWNSADRCLRHITALPYPVYAVEEPLQAGNLEGFRRVGEECGARIVLDESLLRSEQLDGLADPERWIANLRVSKMGGIIRCLDVARRAASLGLGVIVGAQVGETSILTRAGLTVMHAAGPNLVASEGAFGTHLLRHDLITESLMFGELGVIDTTLTGIGGQPGLGLKIQTRSLVSP